MMDFKLIIAVVSIVMTVVGYSYYFRDIFAGQDQAARLLMAGVGSADGDSLCRADF